MTNLTGSRSIFDLTHRDSFPKPNQTGTGGKGTSSCLDAEILNTLGDGILKTESWTQNIITLNQGRSTGYCPTIQRWRVPFVTQPGVPRVPFDLALSPAFLEDCGALTPESAQSQITLAKTSSQGIPLWKDLLQGSRISARLISATGSQTIGVSSPLFHDSGLAPRMTAFLFLSHPDLYGTDLPSGDYEICLLQHSWL